MLEAERDKYRRVWSSHGYRAQSDGEAIVVYAHHVMGCQFGETLIDWGCGTGRPAKLFEALGLRVTGLDIADNCLDEDCDIPLVVGSMWDPPFLESDYAFSSDALEHVPEEFIGLALDAIAKGTRKAAYIQVDTVADISGPAMKPPVVLHLTIRPASWWHRQLMARWTMVIPCAGSFSRVGFLCIDPLR